MAGSFPFSMYDVIGILGLPQPPFGRYSYNIPCPECDSNGSKHLNIHLEKGVYRCAKCGFQGGMLSLYEYYTGVRRAETYRDIIGKLGTFTPYRPTVCMQEQTMADCELRNKAYHVLLKACQLRPEHETNLLGRGISHADIKRLGYCSTPCSGSEHEALSLLFKELGMSPGGVPGFYRQGRQYRLADIHPGIMIPLRDLHGRIQGIQIRLDNADRQKYRFLSSVHKEGGSAAKSWVHIAGRPAKDCEVVITEGALKADVVHSLTGKTVVAVAGVHSLSLLKPVLEWLKSIGISRVMTAYDLDFLTNEHVSKGYDALVDMLRDFNFKYGTYLWDYRYKGIDDFYNAYREKSSGG